MAGRGYSATLRIRNSTPIGPYRSSMRRVAWWSQGGSLFLMSEVPLYGYVWGGELEDEKIADTLSSLARWCAVLSRHMHVGRRRLHLNL